MLCLTRKAKQRIVMGQRLIIDDTIEVTVLKIMGNKVRLGITAPDGVRIVRSELLESEGEE